MIKSMMKDKIMSLFDCQRYRFAYLLFINYIKIVQPKNIRMLSASISSTNQKSDQQSALLKVSSLITRFHAVLLPKANDSGVYRDLSQQQEHLLTSLDCQSPLHSILAGCLAIDSCLSSISQAQQNLTNSILKSLTNLWSVWHKTKNQLIDCVESKSLSIAKIEQLWKHIDQCCRNLLINCQNLPFSQQNQQIKKQQKIMVQQDISFKIGAIKLFQETTSQQNQAKYTSLNLNKNEGDIQAQNLRLQQQLAYTEKKVVQLELKINKLLEGKQNDEHIKQKIQRKYSQTALKQQSQSSAVNFPFFAATPSSTYTSNQKQLSALREQLVLSEQKISKMRDQHSKQKKKLLRQIRDLQQQLKVAYSVQDRELIQLLQQLQDQIQFLRQERRRDQLVIGQIQHKLGGISTGRRSRVGNKYINRQSRLLTNNGIKYSTIFKDRQISDIQSRSPSPSFKKSHIKQRLLALNDQISRSSISMPKIQQHSRQASRHYPQYHWKNERIPMSGSNLYKYQSGDRPNDYNYQRHLPRGQGYIYNESEMYQPVRQIKAGDRNQKGNDHQHHRKAKVRSIYQVPMTQSKFGRQKFQGKAANGLGKRREQKNEEPNINHGYQLQQREKNDDRNLNKVSRWQQIAQSRHIQPRMKTSRI